MQNLSFKSIQEEVEAYKTGFWLSDLSNFSSIVFHHFPEINWAGFYLDDGQKLRLGPFCGKPACTEIAYDRGVCGAAFSQKKTLIVADVDQFPGHITCDSASKSELVIPIYSKGQPIGVFDVDSPVINRFSQNEADQIQTLLQLLDFSTMNLDFFKK